MEQKSFHLIEQASEMSKITLSVIVYAPCPSKTIIKTNKKQLNSSGDAFFLITRYRLISQGNIAHLNEQIAELQRLSQTANSAAIQPEHNGSVAPRSAASGPVEDAAISMVSGDLLPNPAGATLDGSRLTMTPTLFCASFSNLDDVTKMVEQQRFQEIKDDAGE